MPEKPELSMQSYRQRTRRSLLTGGAAALAGFVGWRWIQTQPQTGRIPTVLRRGHEFNESLWSALFRHDHQARTFDRSAASILRVNGRLGIPVTIDPDTRLEIPGVWERILEQWELKVLGPDGSQLGSHVLADIKRLPYHEMTIEHKCIEGWAQITNWGGARFSDFMALYADRLAPDVSHVYLETPNRGYYTSVDIETMLHNQTLLAYDNLGVPITKNNGAPLRLATPLKYGIKQLKHIGTIQFLTAPGGDYWGERGYDWYAGL